MSGFIPEKFYVTRLIRGDDELLSFMQPMHAAGFAARKKTADKWASGWGSGYTKLDPIEVPNEPRAGFSLVALARRYRTDNVLWRIVHPDGYEFEITSENFNKLIGEVTMVNGRIETDLIFVRDGTHNILTPVGSETHKAAKSEKDYFAKAEKGEFNLGDIVNVRTQEFGLDVPVEYLGKCHVLSVDKSHSDGDIEDAKSVIRHVFRKVDGQIYMFSSANVVKVVTPFDSENETLPDVVQILNDLASSVEGLRTSSGYSDIIFAHAKPFKLSDLEVKDVISLLQDPANRSVLETKGMDQYRFWYRPWIYAKNASGDVGVGHAREESTWRTSSYTKDCASLHISRGKFSKYPGMVNTVYSSNSSSWYRRVSPTTLFETKVDTHANPSAKLTDVFVNAEKAGYDFVMTRYKLKDKK